MYWYSRLLRELFRTIILTRIKSSSQDNKSHKIKYRKVFLHEDLHKNLKIMTRPKFPAKNF